MVTSPNPKKAPSSKEPISNVMSQSRNRIQTGEGKLRSEKKSLKSTKKSPAAEK